MSRPGGVAMLGAGILGLIGLASALPYPELYAPGGRPLITLALQPHLTTAWVVHYLVLLGGAVLAVPGTYALSRALKKSGGQWIPAAAALTVVGLAVFAYAAVLRTLMVTRSLFLLVGGGGLAFLLGIFLFNLAIWRTVVLPRWVAVLGLVGTGAQFALAFVFYAGLSPPLIWGILPPPPGDWLLALWFVAVGVTGLRRTDR